MLNTLQSSWEILESNDITKIGDKYSNLEEKLPENVENSNNNSNEKEYKIELWDDNDYDIGMTMKRNIAIQVFGSKDGKCYGTKCIKNGIYEWIVHFT